VDRGIRVALMGQTAVRVVVAGVAVAIE
jgi:hypothetical protein